MRGNESEKQNATEADRVSSIVKNSKSNNNSNDDNNEIDEKEDEGS